MDSKLTFDKILRKETREIHSISDSLVNAKLAFALSNKNVWAEGLLVFYEVFRFLESAMFSNKESNLGKMYVDGMERSSAFEDDLKFYLGVNWKENYKIRESVSNYIKHLQELEKTDSDILIAYVYHLYMGLLSGGQILRKKRDVARRLHFTNKSDLIEGNAVTDFGDKNIRELKHNIVHNLNTIAASLDENKKLKIIKESRTVFELNNEIINSIQGADAVFYKKVLLFSSIVLLLLVIWKNV